MHGADSQNNLVSQILDFQILAKIKLQLHFSFLI